MSAFDTQVGGGHYKDLAIQPMQYSMANGLDACQHTIIKYVTRFREKGGLADLQKARHVIDMLIELEQVNEKEEAPAQDTSWMYMTKKPNPVKEDAQDRRLSDELIAALRASFGANVEVHFIGEETGEI